MEALCASFSPLFDVLFEHDYFLMRHLLRITDPEAKAKEIVQAFVFLVEERGVLRPCVRVLLADEVSRNGGNATLVLRDSMSPAAKFVEQLLTLHGMPFLSSAIGPVLSAYVRNPHSLEVNQSLEPDADKRTANRLAAEKLALDVLDALLAHVAKLPEVISFTIASLASLLPVDTSDPATQSRTAVATVFFLKLLGPLLCSGPQLLESLDLSIPKKAMPALGFSLAVIAKLLQALAAGTRYDPMSHMASFNDFLDANAEKMHQFAAAVLKLGAEQTRSSPVLTRLASDAVQSCHEQQHRASVELSNYRRIYVHTKRSIPVITSLCAESGCPMSADTPTRLRAGLTAVDDARKVYEKSSSHQVSPPASATSSASSVSSSSSSTKLGSRRFSESDVATTPSKRASASSPSSSRASSSSRSSGLYRVGHR